MTIILHGGMRGDFPILLTNCMKNDIEYNFLRDCIFIDSVKAFKNSGYHKLGLDTLCRINNITNITRQSAPDDASILKQLCETHQFIFEICLKSTSKSSTKVRKTRPVGSWVVPLWNFIKLRLANPALQRWQFANQLLPITRFHILPSFVAHNVHDSIHNHRSQEHPPKTRIASVPSQQSHIRTPSPTASHTMSSVVLLSQHLQEENGVIYIYIYIYSHVQHQFHIPRHT